MNSSSEQRIPDGWWINPQPRRREDGKLHFEVFNREDFAPLKPVFDVLIDKFQGVLVSEIHGPDGTSVYRFAIRGITIVLVEDNWSIVDFCAENRQDESVVVALASDLRAALQAERLEDR
jgi:hypothetical protein